MLVPIDPFTVLLALVPLIGYLGIFSVIRLSRRALVTTGGRDIAALAIAISGMLAVGPAELFFPSSAATLFGPLVWLALAAFYALSVLLIALSSPPKLVIYGRTPEEVFEPLVRAARGIDADVVADSQLLQVHLPNFGVRLRIDGQRGLDHATVVPFEPAHSLKFWNALLGNLRTEVRRESATDPVPRRGFGMLIVTILLIGLLIGQGFSNRGLLVEGFRDWLWR